MNHLLSCSFNMDTSCVEARFTDGTMIAVDCKAVFSDEIEGYIKGPAEHRLID